MHKDGCRLVLPMHKNKNKTTFTLQLTIDNKELFGENPLFAIFKEPLISYRIIP